MNKTTTALTELIEFAIELKSKREKAYNFFKQEALRSGTGLSVVAESEGGAAVAYQNIINEAISLLQKEREDMERFFKMVASIYDDDGMGMQEYSKDAKELFDNKFTQYKKETNG